MIHLLSLLELAFGQWVLIAQDFYQIKTPTISGWTSGGSAVTYSRTCGHDNQQQVMPVYGSLTKSLTLPSHFALRVEIDYVYLDQNKGYVVQLSVDGTLVDTFNGNTFNTLLSYCSVDVWWVPHTYIASRYIEIQHSNANVQINIYSNSGGDVNVQNLYVYVQKCQSGCSSCFDYETCIDPIVNGIIDSNNKPQCNQGYPYFTGTQCLSLCENNFQFIQNGKCISNQQQLIYSVNLIVTFDTTYWNLNSATMNSTLVCNNNAIIFQYQNNINNFTQYTQTLLPNHFIKQIQFGIYIALSSNPIHTDTINFNINSQTYEIAYIDQHFNIDSKLQVVEQFQCTTWNYISFYIDQIDQSNTLTINIDQTLSSVQLAIRYLSINLLNCQPNCQTCLNQTYCQQCQTYYYIYVGICYFTCPAQYFADTYNYVCVPKQNKINLLYNNTLEYNQTLIYQFTDNSFTNAIIQSLFQTIPPGTGNQILGNYYSFCNGTKLVGGYATWNKGSFVYSQGIQVPYTRINLSFKLYFIDYSSATIQIQINNGLSQIFRTSSGTLVSNSVLCGDGQDSDIIISDGMSSAIIQSQLIISFTCVGAATLEYCGLRDLHIQIVNTAFNYTYPPSSTFDISNQVISQCSTNCATCKYYPNYCQSCQSGYILKQQGYISNCINSTLNCISPQYADPITQSCQNCASQCANCYASATLCLSCVLNQFRVLSQGQCICQAGYSSSGQDICTNCSFPCLTCNGTICLSCDATKLLVLSGSTCICQTGHYLNGSQCDACSINCLGCSTLTNCTSCKQPQQTLINSTCICSSGYFGDNTTCNQCHQSCLTCAVQNNNCLTCDPTVYRILTNPNKCICQSQYTEVNSICQRCDATCNECTSTVNTCLNCFIIQNRSLTNQNQCVCQNGYFQADAQPICQPCFNSCTTCISESTVCTSCDSVTNHRFLERAQCSCIDGYFDLGQAVCQCILLSLILECYRKCATCTESANICTSCNPQTFRTLNHENCLCLLGYYDNDNAICAECMDSCQSCTNSYTCSTCFMERNQYLNSEEQCVCLEGYFMQGLYCYPCHYSCESCLGYYKCQSCQITRTLQPSHICSCQDGYYEAGYKLCNQCYSKLCMTCTDFKQCTSCVTDRLMVNNQCQCFDGHYSNAVDDCIDCPNLCLTCQLNDNIVDCTSCDPLQHRILFKGTCICQNGYFESEGICQSCQSDLGKLIPSCQYVNCGDGIQTYGEQCDDGNLNIRDGCDNLCKLEETFTCTIAIFKMSICKQCQPHCLSCDQNQCNKCEQAYFNDGTNCNRCQLNCIQCLTYNTCDNCQYGFDPNILSQCLVCNSQQGLYYQNNQCVNICGDSILVPQFEECDDGNQYDGDGCSSNCRIIEQTLHSQIEVTQIQYENNFILSALNEYIPIIGHKCELVHITIDQFTREEFNYTITPKMNDTGFNCTYNMSFYKNIYKYNIMHITALPPQRILDYYQASFTLNLDLTPQQSVYISDSQIQINQQINSVQSSVATMTYVIGALAIFTGGFSIFIAIMEILAWLNNFYFINVLYPPNLMPIFQTPAFSGYFTLPQPITMNTSDDDYFVRSPERFDEQGVDTLFVNNAYIFLLVHLLLVWLVLANRILLKLVLNKHQPRPLRQKSNSQIPIEQPTIFRRQRTQQRKSILQSAVQFIREKSTEFDKNAYSLFIQQSNVYYLDICQASILQMLAFSKIQYSIIQFNFILAMLGFIFIIFMMTLSFKITSKHNYLLNKQFYNEKYESLLEGIDLSKKQGKQYIFMNLVVKVCFVLAQVMFYYQPIIQTSVTCGLSFLNVAFIFYFRPFKTFKELFSEGLPDICIFFILCFCVILAIDQNVHFLDESQFLTIGWIILGIISVSIINQLVFLVIQYVSCLKEWYLYVHRLVMKKRE